MALRHVQRCGHKPVVLLGGATTRVGDPSGKDATRKRLPEAQIAANVESIGRVMRRFLKFGDGPTDAVMVNNEEWLGQIGYLEFLTEVGAHFSVNRMLGFDSVQLRLQREQSLSFLEFNYMCLQAYDFVELSRRFPNLRLQLGGSDQWGNIVCGVELAHKMDRRQLYGLTSPLITKSDGSKMGKSVSGAVWLDPGMLSPFDYWQFWRNVDDADVARFLRIFTDDVDLAHIATACTALAHGEDQLPAIHATALGVFGQQGAAAASGSRSSSRSSSSKSGGGPGRDALPHLDLGQSEKKGGGEGDATDDDEPEWRIADLLVELELCKTKNEGRRLMKQGGVRVEGKAVSSPVATLTAAQLAEAGDVGLMLSVGKKRHGVVIRRLQQETQLL
eukprot:g4699.t1